MKKPICLLLVLVLTSGLVVPRAGVEVEISVEALLYGLLLCSGNDAAAVLADCCGGQETMVERMNAMACRIGMADSSFANPSVSTRKTTLLRPGYGASGGPGSQEPHVHAHLLQRPRGGGGAQHDKSQLIADAPAGLRRHEDGVYPVRRAYPCQLHAA